MTLTRCFNYLRHVSEWPGIYRAQWKPREDIIAFQNRKLKRLIRHAYTRVNYYRRLFDSLGMVPDDISGVTDLPKLPILTKDIILAHYPVDMLSSHLDRSCCSPRTTSGSSGKKLEVVLDHHAALQYRLMQLRQLIDVGYNPFDAISYIRFSPPVTSFFLQKLGLFRRHYIPLEWTPEKQWSAIRTLKPRILNAYPSVLYLLARTIDKKEARQLGLKFLLSNSELLTTHVRHFLEEVFGCKVYNDYSCLEFSAIAFECRLQNMHLASDNVVMEIIDQEGNPLPPGREGRIILTALNNYSMPYLRYEIGDVGALSDRVCSCGRSFPLLQSIIGRCDDFILLPSGKMVDPQTVVFQIEEIQEVREFRVIQHEDLNLSVSLVVEEGVPFDTVAQLVRRKLGVLLGTAIEITLEKSKVLKRGATGKHRSIISLISRVNQ